MEFKTEPWKHQRDALDFIWDKPASMLAMDMGTGKSKVVIDLIANKGYDKILILCPLNVIDIWPKQLYEHHSRHDNYTVIPLDKGLVSKKTKKAELELLRAKTQGKVTIFVINYESARTSDFANFVLKQTWDCVILDESHRIKMPKGKANRFCHKLGKVARKRLCLTGTPMPHSPLDIWGQYYFLNDTIFGRSFYMFKMHYAIMGGYDNREILSFQNMEELHDRMASICFMVKKEDVLDLPDFIDVNLECELSPKAMKIYKEIEKDFITQVESGIVTAANALVKLLRLQQITSGFLRADDSSEVENVDRSKADLLYDLLTDLPNDEPVVIFCNFHSDLNTIREISKKLDRPHSELSGRKNELESWQSGRSNILGVQIRAGGVGIDLTRSRYAIYYSLGFSLGDYEQSRARLHRPGQNRNVTYYHITAKNTVDKKLYSALKKRKDFIKYVLEDIKHEQRVAV